MNLREFCEKWLELLKKIDEASSVAVSPQQLEVYEFLLSGYGPLVCHETTTFLDGSHAYDSAGLIELRYSFCLNGVVEDEHVRVVRRLPTVEELMEMQMKDRVRCQCGSGLPLPACVDGCNANSEHCG